MAERGIILTYEVVQYWRRQFGWAYVKRLRPRRPRHGANWSLDEVVPYLAGDHGLGPYTIWAEPTSLTYLSAW